MHLYIRRQQTDIYQLHVPTVYDIYVYVFLIKDGKERESKDSDFVMAMLIKFDYGRPQI